MERKFGFVTGDGTLEFHMGYAIDHRFDQIEIDLSREDTKLESFDRQRIHRLKKLSFENGLSFSLHLPFTLNLIAGNRLRYKKTIALIRHAFDLAADLNAAHITSHIGSFSKQIIWSDPREEYLKKAIESIRLIAEICNGHHIRFALENLIPLQTHSAYHFIGDNIRDFSEIFSSLESEFIGLCLDLGHANLNEGALEYIDAFNEKIFCVHYHDNNGKRDDHLELGEGNIPWRQIVSRLDKTGYTGPFLSECFSSEPRLSRENLKKYMKPVRRNR